MKPRILDLFSGAGGAAMGYHRAGFDVVGVDIKPQPRYPFEFHQADALDLLVNGWIQDNGPWSAIHGSPPCQRYSQASKGHGTTARHPDFIRGVRKRFSMLGFPWVVENVVGAPMHQGFRLCGSMFDLPVRRHRLFDCSELIMPPAHSGCAGRPVINFYGHRNGHSIAEAPAAIGVPWMTPTEALQAVPPAYTRFIGEQLLEAVRAVA